MPKSGKSSDNHHRKIELQGGDEAFDSDDPRAIYPQRTSQDLDKMSQDARRQLPKLVPSTPI
jgi:hypothetical protein